MKYVFLILLTFLIFSVSLNGQIVGASNVLRTSGNPNSITGLSTDYFQAPLMCYDTIGKVWYDYDAGRSGAKWVELSFGSSSTVSINQTSHGLTLFDPVYYDTNTGNFEIANNNSADSLAWGMVVEIVDGNNFKFQNYGVAEITSHGFDVGSTYVLGSGFYQKPDDLLEGDIYRWCFTVLDTNQLLMGFVSNAFFVDDLSVAIPDAAPSNNSYIVWDATGAPSYIYQHTAAGLSGGSQFFLGNNPVNITVSDGMTYIIRVDNTNYNVQSTINLLTTGMRNGSYARFKIIGADIVPVTIDPNQLMYHEAWTSTNNFVVNKKGASFTVFKVNETTLMIFGSTSEEPDLNGLISALPNNSVTINADSNNLIINNLGIVAFQNLNALTEVQSGIASSAFSSIPTQMFRYEGVDTAWVRMTQGVLQLRDKTGSYVLADLVGGSGSSVDSITTEVAVTTTAVMRTILPVDCSAGPITINPPASPTNGDWFAVLDSGSDANVNNITIDFVTATQNLSKTSQNFILNTESGYVRFTYSTSTNSWHITN